MFRQTPYRPNSCLLVLHFTSLSNLRPATMVNLYFHLKISVNLHHQKGRPALWKEQPVRHPGSKQELLVESYRRQIRSISRGFAAFVERAPTWAASLGQMGFYVQCAGNLCMLLLHRFSKSDYVRWLRWIHWLLVSLAVPPCIIMEHFVTLLPYLMEVLLSIVGNHTKHANWGFLYE
jgi:hypothetical protein